MKKILVSLGLVLTILAVAGWLWLTREPTTQLVDQAGQELTAGQVGGNESTASGDALFGEAHALIEKRDFAAAKERLLEIIEHSDRDGEACVLLCNVSRELKDADGTADYGLKATKLMPDSAEAHLAYAKAIGLQMFSDMQSISGMISAMTRLAPFKQAIDRVIELDPMDTEARSMLVFYHMSPKPIGDIERAIQVCRDIEQLDPVAGRQLLASCFNRNSETERAIELLKKSILEFPGESGFHVTLADIYSGQKRFNDADAEYEAARQEGKSEAYYRSLYGQARMRIVNKYGPERAIELLDQFIDDQPRLESVQTVAHAWWRKGNALEQLGRNQDARHAYSESLRHDPQLKLAQDALKALGE